MPLYFELIGLGDDSQQSTQLLFVRASSLNLPAQSFHEYGNARLSGNLGATIVLRGLNETSFATSNAPARSSGA
jgi:hypothetical protein